MTDRMVELLKWVRAQEEQYNRHGSWSKAAAFQDVRLKIEELGAFATDSGCKGCKHNLREDGALGVCDGCRRNPNRDGHDNYTPTADINRC